MNITTRFVNNQVIPSEIHRLYFLGIQKLGEVKEEEELNTMLKRRKLFSDVILDCEILTYLENTRYLVEIVNKSKFKAFITLFGKIYHAIATWDLT